jgi:hypothetical protein
VAEMFLKLIVFVSLLKSSIILCELNDYDLYLVNKIKQLNLKQIITNRFKDKYEKNYSEYERKVRQIIYDKNLEKIEQHNNLYDKGESTYKLGVNDMTDMTFEEITKHSWFV